jgi:predicted ferric reductase/Ca2+-binding EF-hand superfamily protein
VFIHEQATSSRGTELPPDLPMQPSPEPTSALLRIMERSFANLASSDGAIDAGGLKQALGLRAEYLARRILALFDLDGDGFIRRDEFLEGVRKLVLGTVRDKLSFAFRLHDHDGDGSLDRLDLTRMVTLALAEDDVSVPGAKVERLVTALLSEADSNGDGRISFEEFEAAVGRHPHLLDQMTRDEARWLCPNEDLLARAEEGHGGPPARSTWSQAGFRPAVFVAVWALANVLLFALGMLPKSHAGRSVDLVSQIGRATTGPIELDGAVILFPVLRRLLTWVRRTWLARALPVDDAVSFHRLVGHTLFAFCAVHGAAIWIGYGRSSQPFLAQLANERALTGTVLLGIFTVMWVCAWQMVRHRSFEVFYFTHLLYVPWFVLAIAHAPGTLAAAAVALAGLAFEQTVRLARRAKKSAVVELSPLRSGVTRLLIRRPPGFEHAAGDYLFLRIPDVARHEWHPFTITSAPECEALTVHSRCLGNWTSALRRRAETQTKSGGARELVAHLDGPYGSPSGHVFESRYAVLVGAGIGVTPFASILESIVLRANGHGERPSTLRKAHFFWVNRDRYSFEWFAALLAELERIDGAGVLTVDLWMTGGRAGATSAALELAREVEHAAGQRDVFTGLRTKTHVGHPDWSAILLAIAKEHAAEKVDVFFCGPPGLGRIVRRASARAGMPFRDEKF